MTVSHVGLTKDAGYQVGVRKTLEINPEEAWDFFFSKGARCIWLGKIEQERLEKETPITTAEGVHGRLTTMRVSSHFRMKWRLTDWPNDSILQVRLIPKGSRTTISFHQEKLNDQEQRKMMKQRWTDVLIRLERLLQSQVEK